MIQNIKVSIIIPVFNKGEYIAQCLNSILSQSIQAIEIIAVNDGSTDNSLQILNEYKAKDDRLVIVDQTNQGAGISRNHGIMQASGEFIAFMDPDDWYPDDDVLECLYSMAKKNDVLICGGSFSSWIDGRILKEYSGLNKAYVFDRDALWRFADYQFDYGYHRFIYNRAFIIDNSLFFPDYLRYQDPPFFARAMTKAQVFFAIKKTVYCYREAYQVINWTARKCKDLLKGLIDVLTISKEHHLARLHYLNYSRLNSKSYCDIFLTHIQNDPEIIRLLIKANQIIDRPMLSSIDETVKRDSLIYPLRVHLFNDISKSALDEQSDQMPDVSIIVPVYNVQAYLDDCLNSLITQSHFNIEIICVNDGSTDRSVDIIKDYMNHDQRIVYVDKINGGLSSARNAGVKVATGQYILFTDSDDMLHQDAIKILLQEASRDKLDILYFDADSFYDNEHLKSTKRTYHTYYHRKKYFDQPTTGPRLFIELKSHNEYRSSACLQFINRTFYLNSNLSFYEGIIHEDNLFSLDAILKADRVRHIKKNLYLRRVRNDSIMTEPESAKNLHGYLATYCETLYYLAKNDFTDSVRHAIITELDMYVKAIRRVYDKLSPEDRTNYVSQLSIYRSYLLKNLITTTADTHQQVVINPVKDNQPITKFVYTKLRKGIRCYNEHGFLYTLRRLIGKIKNKILK